MPKFTIKSIFEDRILYECEADSMREALEAAVRADANLARAYLARAYLADANLTNAYLARAYLADANLTGANLARAYLADANLTGAAINWQSHDLIAEIIRRAAGEDVRRRMVAGLVLVSRDWCWDRFLVIEIEPDLRKWAIAELRPWVKDGDNAPEVLRVKEEGK